MFRLPAFSDVYTVSWTGLRAPVGLVKTCDLDLTNDSFGIFFSEPYIGNLFNIPYILLCSPVPLLKTGTVERHVCILDHMCLFLEKHVIWHWSIDLTMTPSGTLQNASFSETPVFLSCPCDEGQGMFLYVLTGGGQQ